MHTVHSQRAQGPCCCHCIARYLCSYPYRTAVTPTPRHCTPAGGPALQNDQVVGVAFQNLPGAENIGTYVDKHQRASQA